ncbi:polysaccharide pyruvyl transferase family protein [Luteimicrobium sp. NPDC057192]|uniref:polysaccharide pyruvyl transferase family protein n=1 Tax=Luteimicrobium sp. NPDC057192 TaxID=3346042 RepID=UPI00362A49BA
MSRHVRVSLVGEFGVGNYGNDACLEHELEVLRSARDVDVTVLCHLPDVVSDQHHVRARPVVAPVRHPRSLVGRMVMKGVDTFWLGWLVLRSDVLVVPGTGVFETQWAVPGAIPFVLCVLGLWSFVLRRPLLALSVGADDAGSPLARRLSTAALRLSTLVTVRDDASAAAVADRTGSTPRVVPDLVLGDPRSALVAAQPGVVGLGLLAYDGAAGYRNPDAVTRDAYVARARELVVRLVDLGKQVVLLRGSDSDGTFVELLDLEELVARGKVRVSDASTLPDVEAEVAAMEVLVASRYHNLLVAARTGTPMVALGYGRSKQREILRLADLEDYAWPITDFDPERVVAQVKELADRPRLRERIASRADRASAAVRAQDDWLRRSVEAGGPPARRRHYFPEDVAHA